jgi:hypothetical protein
MNFSRDRVSCDDFGDCHDEIAVAGVDFIITRPICFLHRQAANITPFPSQKQKLFACILNQKKLYSHLYLAKKLNV